MKKFLLFFVATLGLIGSAMAGTYTVTYDKGAGGTFYNSSDAAVSGGWAVGAIKWISSGDAPVVTISSTSNPFQSESGNGHLAAGRRFTISVAGNYLITGYTLKTQEYWGKSKVTPEGGEAFTFNSVSDILEVPDLSTTSTYFDLADQTMAKPLIVISLEDLPDYTSQVNANIQPFVDHPGTGYFHMSSENATTLKTKITSYKGDGIISSTEYDDLLTDLKTYVNFPATGYFRIKNNSTSNYITYGQPSYYDAGLITTNSSGAESVIKLTANDIFYKISAQGLNVQAQTSGNHAFPGTTASGVDFLIYPSGDGVLSITNADSKVNSDRDGSLHEATDGWDIHGVVNWSASAGASKWLVEDVTTFSGTLTNAKDNTATVHSYATLCVPFDISDLTGAEAYMPSVNDGYVQLGDPAEVSDGILIPAGTPVILVGAKDAGTYTATIKTGGAYVSSPLTENALTGIFASDKIDTRATTGKNYVLGFDEENDNRIGFYHVDNTNFPLGANRAYLHIDGGGVKGFTINLDQLVDGIVSIEKGKPQNIYNLAGQRLNKIQKGVNIVSGKVVLF